MLTCKVKRHIEVNENFQGFNLTEFQYSDTGDLPSNEIAEQFIRSQYFKFDCLPEVVKNNSENKNYLRQAFDINEISIDDFKKFDKSGTHKFLNDFLNDPDWADDKKDFASLLDKYLLFLGQLPDADFFIISKEWFEKDDSKVLEPERWVYNYYFLVLYIDKNSRTLSLTEWAYD